MAKALRLFTVIAFAKREATSLLEGQERAARAKRERDGVAEV
jgi:hypothetical protein